jgi:hypothetical protein
VGTSLGAATLWKTRPRMRLRTILGELLDHMEGVQGVESRISQEYLEYEARDAIGFIALLADRCA